MITVSIKSNIDRVMASYFLTREQIEEAMRIALNKTVKSVQVAAAREAVAGGYKVKVSVIKDGIRIVQASKGTLSAKIIATGKPISLFEYAARWGGPGSDGVSVSVLSGRKMIKGAFIATMPNGKRGVFVRAPNARHKKVNSGNKPSWHALPIRQLYGPSVADMFNNPRVEQAMFRRFAEQAPKNMAHELRRAWKRAAVSIGNAA